MPNFELLEEKKPKELVAGDHIIIDGKLWRIEEKFRLLGHHCGFMFRLAYYTHDDPQGFKFHEIKDEFRLMTFRPID